MSGPPPRYASRATSRRCHCFGPMVANLPERIADPQLGRLSATHIYDLISLAIGATDEGQEIASQRGVRTARFESIKADILQNATLSLDQVAARQGVSPRYVQI